MTRIIAMTNHKGGVGKTTTTLNLGKAFSLSGHKVLLIDIDPQANLSQSLGYDDDIIEGNIYDVLCEEKTPNIIEITDTYHLLPSSLDLATAEIKLQSEWYQGCIKLKKKLGEIVKDYDYVLIDCPPSLGILTINALVFATDMLIVAQGEYLSIKGLNTITNFVRNAVGDLNPTIKNLGVVFTLTHRTTVNKLIQESIKENHKVVQTSIRRSVKFSEASVHKQDIFTYDPDGTGAEDYQNLANEIKND